MGLFGGSSRSTVANTSTTQNVQGVSGGAVFGDVAGGSHVRLTLTDHGAIAAGESATLAATELATRSIEASAQLAREARGALTDVVGRSLDLVEQQRGSPEAGAIAEATQSVTRILIYLIVVLGLVGGAIAFRRS